MPWPKHQCRNRAPQTSIKAENIAQNIAKQADKGPLQILRALPAIRTKLATNFSAAIWARPVKVTVSGCVFRDRSNRSCT